MKGYTVQEERNSKQRIEEVVQILARGFLRLNQKQPKDVSGDYFVDFPASPGIHASVKNMSNMEE